ncbi:MAG TPA: hypothetical protein VHO67_08195 [Polyangia bacterium]|nr:hypothetical protein [Polyangia bacterium]
MRDSRALVPGDSAHSLTLEARVEPAAELLRAPASGLPCVHWRLRVVEHLTARSELVHDLASPDAFELAWGNTDGGRPPVRIRLEPDSARIEATPSLHRAGTPGAVAVARAFGFRSDITVEEVVIRPGEEVTADGVLQDLGFGGGPFRAPAETPALALSEATVRLQTRALAPAMLIPWAFGTAAALLGGMGLTTWAAWRYHLAHLPAISQNLRPFRAAPAPSHLTPPDLPRQRFP